MKQVGDTVHLMAYPVPSGSDVYSYVWEFWDGSSAATAHPFVTKTLNIGGRPGTDELHYTCRPVSRDGQSVALPGVIEVNNPPVILPGASASNNGAYYPFDTRLQVRAIDLDGDALTFGWYTGDSYLGAGVAVSAGVADGTWTGNGVVDVQAYPVTSCALDVTVASARTVTCRVIDARGGTRSVDFALQGEPNPAPDARLSAGVGGVSFDATTPLTARVGAGQSVALTLYVAAMPQHYVQFLWTFNGSNNWTMAPGTDTGVTTYLEDGGVRNTVQRDISAEVFSSGTEKTVTAKVRVLATNLLNSEQSYVDAQTRVVLVKNTAPEVVQAVRRVGPVTVSGDGPVASGSRIEYSAEAADRDGDVVSFLWRFNHQIPGVPNPLYLWGSKVLVDTSGAPTGAVLAQVTAFDRLGGTATLVLPATALI